ncbi:DUF4238 domain-containing protein [Pseudomonas putida]|uniref:DUF4238 domain-containing protein n=1 Tax=Pseudomonas putida TaxID=303 RepID=UPI0023633CEE|nr:DUF4238 domain-containing protein [Pseudomonas putida]MDD2144694.1 DUF4238 domain-containing protein [Pseudomonas putida]HDS1709066.1 DUF4238 domain-containing protein [Pseudomonas putida]
MERLRKDNHYVPKLYLKQWAKEGQVPTYRLLVPSDKNPLWKSHSLKGIAFHQHLYTYVVGQDETDEFERWLDSEFEGPAEQAIYRAVNDLRMCPDHWRLLIRFAVALDVRTPARLREFLKRQNETLPDLMNDLVQRSVSKLERAVSLREPLPVLSEESDLLAPFRVSIEEGEHGGGRLKTEAYVGRRMWVWQMKHLLTHTLGKLPAHKWTILRPPSGMTWPTSDNPLIRLNFQDGQNYNFKGGWGVKNGDILLPLGPKHLLYTCMGNRARPRGSVLDHVSAGLIRRIIIEHADRYVFATEPGDIHLIRPRLVCPITFTAERTAWQNWHSEQSEAERAFGN